MKRRMRARSIVWALLIAFPLLGVSVYWAGRFWAQPVWSPFVLWRVNDAVNAMPSVLGSPKVAFFATGPGFIERMLGLGSCGGGLFLIEEALADRVEEEGLSFFADAPASREPYAPWQETPIAASWNWEGTYTTGLQCMKPRREIFEAIGKAISEPGAYFTFRPGVQILVLPRSQVVLLTFS